MLVIRHHSRHHTITTEKNNKPGPGGRFRILLDAIYRLELMDDKSLNNLTLSTWAATVWGKELRGVPLQIQEASLAWCMRQHAEYRNFWNSLGTTAADTPRAGNILLHIYSDGAVKLQLESNNPPEITQLFQAMRAKGFSDMDALHAIAHVLKEENWNAK